MPPKLEQWKSDRMFSFNFNIPKFKFQMGSGKRLWKKKKKIHPLPMGSSCDRYEMIADQFCICCKEFITFLLVRTWPPPEKRWTFDISLTSTNISFRTTPISFLIMIETSFATKKIIFCNEPEVAECWSILGSDPVLKIRFRPKHPDQDLQPCFRVFHFSRNCCMSDKNEEAYFVATLPSF